MAAARHDSGRLNDVVLHGSRWLRVGYRDAECFDTILPSRPCPGLLTARQRLGCRSKPGATGEG